MFSINWRTLFMIWCRSGRYVYGFIWFNYWPSDQRLYNFIQFIIFYPFPSVEKRARSFLSFLRKVHFFKILTRRIYLLFWQINQYVCIIFIFINWIYYDNCSVSMLKKIIFKSRPFLTLSIQWKIGSELNSEPLIQ